ncbi:MAG TPA: hypothetical protein VFC07_12430, partial [Verrucomicrobiae bacterium]|nr:hypothetical protein [Verrucomicrobiae bacterium]
LQDASNLTSRPVPLRPQWLENGHSILTTWRPGVSDSDTSLNIAVLPFDRREPTRVFMLPDLSNDGATLFYFWPVPVAGKFLFLTGQSNSILRLDIGTGEMRRETNQQNIVVLPSPDNDRLFYLSEVENSNNPSEFGLLNLETFARTPIFHIPEGKVSLLSLALSRDAKRFAYQLENENPPLIHLLETGKPARTFSLASLPGKTDVSVRQFSSKGDLLYASCKNTPAGHTNDDYGFLEIPLDGSSIRKTVLISNTPPGDKDVLASFQIDLSHDGKTMAVESLWLTYGGVLLKPEDCALFLVDLSNSRHKVTKVPIPLPPKDRPSPFGK